jgi:DNA-binding CsgD family transcriptional regulator
MAERDLTLKERKLIKGIVAGKSQTQSAVDAGYSVRSAAALATHTLKKVNVRNALLAAMQKAGITDEALADKMREGMDAQTDKDRPDHAIRHRFLETALKVRGDFAPEKHLVGMTTLAEWLAREEARDGEEGNAPPVAE